MDIKASPPTINLKETTVSADINKEKKLRKACADFEAIMLNQMLRMARQSMPEGGLFGGGHAEEMYRSMLDEELSIKLAHAKGIGLGELLFQQISKQHPTTTGRK